MIVIKLKGGLGNQMFQYALGRSLSIKNNTNLILDVSELEDTTQKHTLRNYELDHFTIQAEISSSQFITDRKTKKIDFSTILNVFTFKKILKFIQEKNTRFDYHITQLPDNSYLNGYWNSPKYFEENTEIIKTDFTFKDNLTAENIIIAEKISSCISVSLHIRRGDYISNPEVNAYHGTCTNEYYTKAVNLIIEKNKNAVFFIFTDDPIWVKNNFKIDAEYFIVSKPENLNGLQDMHLMSLCQHAIIANSTFSWWAAWLIKNKHKIIIAPKKWFNDSSIMVDDLFPKGWIRI